MEFKENLLQALPEEDANKLIESLNDSDKHAVLLNTRFISDEDFVKLYPNIKPHPIVKHAFLYDKNEYQLGKSIYHELGYFYLQEPSAMVVSSLIDFSEDDFVLDMCGAPGGKTVQSAFRLNNKGTIISNDLSRSRAEIISNNVERLGLKNIIISNNDFEKIYTNFLNCFDKIILDAPCSGSGMFRKDDKMLNDWSINKVYKFAETQKRLISIAYQMLKPGGTLSYSTCSYSIQENEEVIHFLMDTTDAELISMPKIGYINQKDPIGIRLMPSIFPGEGQYICLIKKPDNPSKNNFKYSNNYKNIVPQFLDKLNIVKYNDTYFYTDHSVNTSKLSILRYGVKIGEYLKGIMHYDLHFARTLNDEMPSIEISLEEVKNYLAGNTLSHTSNIKGNVLLKYKNNSIDIAKTDGVIIKNHYPKGLRKKF